MEQAIKRKIRCAIYTRKSTEEGLDLEYNSLDNQYDSCKKYIESQQHEGWCLVNKRYDDGGFSGGNLERPALKQLMRDIQNNQIDMVVVYKIDRLSRSLLDFARLAGVFEANKTSFVSVTQNFNTNDSMGKLMLNILLSFAQFEREMTGDRIRDKIRMQKSKGMWTGGTPPLGYDIIEKKLIINEAEAEQVRLIFNTFIETESVGETLNTLKRAEIKTKTYTSKTERVQGGNEFNRGTLYKMLKNKLYIGLIENKNTNQIYDGLHEKIIPEADFNRVQDLFNKNLNKKIYDKKTDKTGLKTIYAPKKDTNIPYLLKGIMKCECCNSVLTPTFTTKKSGLVYRYYKANKAIKHSINIETGKECQLPSIKAEDIEKIILNQIYGIIRTPTIVSKIIDRVNLKNKQINITEQDIINHLKNIEAVWDELFPIQQVEIIQMLIKEIIVSRTNIKIVFNNCGFLKLVAEATGQEITKEINAAENNSDFKVEVNIPVDFKYKAGRSFITTPSGKEVIIKNTRARKTTSTNYNDNALLHALVKAEDWKRELIQAGNFNGDKQIETIAKREGKNNSYICRILSLTYLAPSIKKAILTGNVPLGLSLKDIYPNTDLLWADQKENIKFGMAV